MNDNQRIEQLLAQILDTERASLDEYKRVTGQSLALQRSAVDTQNRHVRLYRRVIAVSVVIIAALLGYVAWLSRLIP